jgi:hypothetical protein
VSSTAAGGAGGRWADFAAHASTCQPVTSAAAAAAAAPDGSLPVSLSAAVVVDALGSFSPLSAQARGAAPPEAAMLLVGSCVDTPTAATAAATAAAGGSDMLWGMDPIDT